MTTRPLPFFSSGLRLDADLHLPDDGGAGAPYPVVIACSGYQGQKVIHPERFARALSPLGYAVLAFDQSGFGSRMGEAAPFYDRYPHWSTMGQMVDDARAAVDALSHDSLVDPERISLYGYSIGGAVGLHAAALDPRVKSVVSVSGFTPMRTDTADRGTGGIARYYDVRGLIPRLGFFAGQAGRARGLVDQQLADPDRLAGRRAGRAPHHGPDPGGDLLDAEWLHDVVVGPGVERADHGRVVVDAGDHDDRQLHARLVHFALEI